MSAVTTSQSHHDGLPAPQRYMALAVLFVSLVLVVLDGAIANVALPSIAASFNASPSDTVWVVSSYQLAVLVALLPCGALGEIIGPRRVFLAGVAAFTISSAICAFAGSLSVLILARFVQGLGGGAIMALIAMNLRFAVPHRMLGTVIGFNAMVIAISSAAGPGIAGAILAVAHWPWLFAVNVPIGIIILLSGGLLSKVGGLTRRLSKSVLLANALMFVLFFTGADQMTSAPIFGAFLIVASILCLLAVLYMERGVTSPIVPTDLLAAPAFRSAAITSVLCFASQTLSFVALPFYLHHNLDMSPIQIGLFMMPWPITVAVVAPIAAQLAKRIKVAWLCAVGAAFLAVGLFIIDVFPTDSAATAFLVGTVLAGIGFGLFQTPNNQVLLLSVPKVRSGAAGAAQGTARLMGQTIGSISMSLIFASVSLSNASTVALGVASLSALLASFVSLSRVRQEVVA